MRFVLYVITFVVGVLLLIPFIYSTQTKLGSCIGWYNVIDDGIMNYSEIENQCIEICNNQSLDGCYVREQKVEGVDYLRCMSDEFWLINHPCMEYS